MRASASSGKTVTGSFVNRDREQKMSLADSGISVLRRIRKFVFGNQFV